MVAHSRLRGFHGAIQGMSLVELLVAMAISSAIGGVMAMSLTQIWTITERVDNHTQSSTELQHAGLYLDVDGTVAQVLTPDAGDSGFPMALFWEDWDNTTHDVVYSVSDTNLLRAVWVDGVASGTRTLMTTLDPDPSETNCRFEFDLLTVQLTAVKGQGTARSLQTRIFEISPRTMP